jgi:hypothetical protein
MAQKVTTGIGVGSAGATKTLGQILSPGDVAIVQYASSGPDAFTFVALRDIEAGTTINFTATAGWLPADSSPAKARSRIRRRP